MIKREIRALLLAAACAVGTGAAAEGTPAVDPAWGDFADLAGRAANAGPEGYRLRWYWAVPGKELVQEYRNPGIDTVAHREVITLGATPGTLVLQSSALGKKQWLGTLQPDGRVLFIGKGLLKLPYVAGEAEDGTWQVRQVKLDGARIASEEVVRSYARYAFESADAPADAAATPQVVAAPTAPTVPVASAASAAPTAPAASTTQIASTAPASQPPPTLAKKAAGLFSALTQAVGLSSDDRPAAAVAAAPAVPEPAVLALPTLDIGSEIAGTLENGHRGKHGPAVPIGAYRFAGTQGQRICARVASPDAYMHVYVAESLSPASLPFSSSWLPTYEDTAYVPFLPTHPRSQGTSLMTTLPRTGDYVVYVMAHQAHQVRNHRGFVSHRYAYQLPATAGGRYEVKLWDADAPEPVSTLPGQARQQHPDSGEAFWIGNFRYLTEAPLVNTENGIAVRASVDGTQVRQHAVSVETGKAFPDWVYQSTGRRGGFTRADTGQRMQVQCDGSWTLSEAAGITLHYRMYGSGENRSVQIMRVQGVSMFGRPGIGGSNDYVANWSALNETNVGYALESLQYQREEAVEMQQRRARRDAEESADRAQIFAGVMNAVTTFGNEMARNQHQQAQIDATIAEARRQQAVQRNANVAAAEAKKRLAQRQSQVPAAAAIESFVAAPQTGIAGTPPASTDATPYRALAGNGTGSWENAGGRSSSSSAGQASTRDRADTCVSPPVTSTHRCGSMTGYKGLVSNTCRVPVEVRMCFMTATGWNCQRNTLGPQQNWEPGWCHANTGEVFHSVRYKDSKEPLASP